MKPSSLRRFGMAAVAGALLLASGAIPTFGQNSSAGDDAADLEQGGDLDRELPVTAGAASPLDALLDAGRDLWRTVQDIQRLIWLGPADNGTPIAPATTIVDDGAPF